MLLDDVVRGPIARAAADIVNEALDDLLAVLGVGDLGMKLQTVISPFWISHAGQRRVRRCGDRHESIRESVDSITVAHPDAQALSLGHEPPEQRAVGRNLDFRVTELAMVCRAHGPAELGSERLHAVTDT